MKKVLLLAAMALAALFATVGMAPTANAYPETTCSVDLSAQVVHEGDSFTVNGSATSTTSPRTTARATADQFNWVVTFNGETRTGSGSTIKASFTAPSVDAKSVLPVTIKVVMPDATANCERSANITVLPDGTAVEAPGGGGIPNLGGPRLSLLIAGVALLLAGAYAVRRSRQAA